MDSFDFDYWKTLAAVNPDEFEQRKKAALLELVASARPAAQAQLRSLVDAVCQPMGGTPLDRALVAQKMMLSSVLDLQAKSLELVNAQSEQTQLAESVALKFSKLVLASSS